MPVDIHIIRACEFVRFGAKGEFDFESTRAMLVNLASACHKRGLTRSLIDVRGATSNLTPKDLATLVSAFGKAVPARHLRLAILHNARQNYRAKMFVFFSAMRGQKVQAFEDFEEALVWLSKQTGARATPASPNDEVPIRAGNKTRIIVKDKPERA
jgi:hypothetical protein